MKKIKDIADYQSFSVAPATFIRADKEYYTALVCIYALLLVTAQIMGHRMIELFHILEPGGIFIFPLVYTFGDIITEVYGIKKAKLAIYFAVFAQAIFTIFTSLIAYLPAPANWNDGGAYKLIFNYSGMVFLSNLTVVALSLLVNSRLISYLKIKLNIAPFPIRSFIATTTAEMISTGAIVLIGFGLTDPFSVLVQLFVDMMIFKIIYAFIAMFPANLLVKFIKKKEKHVY